MTQTAELSGSAQLLGHHSGITPTGGQAPHPMMAHAGNRCPRHSQKAAPHPPTDGPSEPITLAWVQYKKTRKVIVIDTRCPVLNHLGCESGEVVLVLSVVREVRDSAPDPYPRTRMPHHSRRLIRGTECKSNIVSNIHRTGCPRD
jgi:hypothetical protein